MMVQRAAVARQATIKPVQGLIRSIPRMEARADSRSGLDSGTGRQQIGSRSSQRSILSGFRLRLEPPSQVARAGNNTQAKRDLVERYESNASWGNRPSGELIDEMTKQLDQGGTAPRLVATYHDGAVYSVAGRNVDQVLPDLEDGVFRFIEHNPAAWFPHELSADRMNRKTAVYFVRDKSNRVTSIAVVRFAERTPAGKAKNKVAARGNVLRGYVSYFEGFPRGANQVLKGIVSDMQNVDPTASAYNSIRAIEYGLSPYNEAWAGLVKAKLDAGFKEEQIMGTPVFDALQKAFDLARVEMLRQNWLKHLRLQEPFANGWAGPSDPDHYPRPFDDDRRKRFHFFEERANRIWGAGS